MACNVSLQESPWQYWSAGVCMLRVSAPKVLRVTCGGRGGSWPRRRREGEAKGVENDDIGEVLEDCLGGGSDRRAKLMSSWQCLQWRCPGPTHPSSGSGSMILSNIIRQIRQSAYKVSSSLFVSVSRVIVIILQHCLQKRSLEDLPGLPQVVWPGIRGDTCSFPSSTSPNSPRVEYRCIHMPIFLSLCRNGIPDMYLGLHILQ